MIRAEASFEDDQVQRISTKLFFLGSLFPLFSLQVISIDAPTYTTKQPAWTSSNDVLTCRKLGREINQSYLKKDVVEDKFEHKDVRYSKIQKTCGLCFS